jgi:DNA-binding NtrC family response regulator
VAIALVTPPGVDGTGWAAHAHLASPRSGGPFVVCDATLSSERSLERWNDPALSPSRLADGGTLLVLDVDALPLDVQEHLGSTLAAPCPTESKLPPPELFVTAHAPLETLGGLGKIAPSLRRVAFRQITLPSLAERAEDLRSLVLGALSRASQRLGREPLGIEPSALRLVVDSSFTGNEIELEALLVRAARVARGKAVSVEDLGSIGFDPQAPARPEPTPMAPPTARRRAPRRFPRGR